MSKLNATNTLRNIYAAYLRTEDSLIRDHYDFCPNGKLRGPECLCRGPKTGPREVGNGKISLVFVQEWQKRTSGSPQKAGKARDASPQGSKARRAARAALFWVILYIFPKEDGVNFDENTAPSTEMRTSTNLSGAFTMFTTAV